MSVAVAGVTFSEASHGDLGNRVVEVAQVGVHVPDAVYAVRYVNVAFAI